MSLPYVYLLLYLWTLLCFQIHVDTYLTELALRINYIYIIYIALGKGTNFSQNLDVKCFDAAQVAWWLGCMVAACKRASLRYRHAFVAQDSPQWCSRFQACLLDTLDVMAKWQAVQFEGSTLSHGCHKASLIGMRFTGSSKQEMDRVQSSQKRFGTLPQIGNGSIQVPAVCWTAFQKPNRNLLADGLISCI